MQGSVFLVMLNFFFVLGSNCPIPGCTSCDPNIGCTVACTSPYFGCIINVNVNSCCFYCSANCAVGGCSYPNSCNICEGGFYLNTQGDCEACALDCTACLSASQCTACQTGYALSNGNCILVATCNAPCLVCDSRGGCIECNAGYVLQNGQCTSSTPSCSNCAQCDNYGYCQECFSSYQLQGGLCVYSPGHTSGSFNLLLTSFAFLVLVS
jgi:hypothetical protein